jgi:hypothetical protein
MEVEHRLRLHSGVRVDLGKGEVDFGEFRGCFIMGNAVQGYLLEDSGIKEKAFS